MSILVNKDTRVVVQGITGREGAFHASKMKEYGTQRGGRRHAWQGWNRAGWRASLRQRCRTR